MKDNIKHLISRAFPPERRNYDYYDLMFHSVKYGARHRYELEPKNFEEIVLSISADVNFIQLSFDDGLASVYENTRYIINNLNILPRIFVSTNCIGHEGYLSIKQIDHLRSDGWIIGAHGHDHVPLGRLSDEDCRFQLEKSLSVLQDISSENCQIPMSLPFGSFNSNTLQHVKQAGFAVCYNSILGGWNSGDFFRKRIEIWRSDDGNSVRRKLQGRYKFLVKS